MSPTKFNPTVLRACLWTGPLFALAWLVAAGPLAMFILPPPPASNSAAETVATYTEQLTAVRIGCLVMILTTAIYGVWGIVLTLYTREAEGHRPALFWIQMISIALCAVVVMLIGFFWGVAAFRPGEVDPEITQALNDIGWFGVLFTGAPFGAYQIAFGCSVLLDRSERPRFPRWLAFCNFFVSFFMFEAGLILFFKDGAFSQNGAVVFYLPMLVFFVWILVMSRMGFRAVAREEREVAGAGSAPAGARVDDGARTDRPTAFA